MTVAPILQCLVAAQLPFHLCRPAVSYDDHLIPSAEGVRGLGTQASRVAQVEADRDACKAAKERLEADERQRLRGALTNLQQNFQQSIADREMYSTVVRELAETEVSPDPQSLTLHSSDEELPVLVTHHKLTRRMRGVVKDAGYAPSKVLVRDCSPVSDRQSG